MTSCTTTATSFGWVKIPEVMKHSGLPSMSAFNDVFVRQINAIYKKKSIKALTPQTWPGVICQPFVFGAGKVDFGKVRMH